MVISGNKCELLFTLFSNSNCPNLAVFIFVQRVFVLGCVYSIQLNNQYWGVRYQVFPVWDRNEQGLLNAFM